VAELLRQDRDWRDYPLGTKAHAYNGGAWLRTERGWTWNGHTRAPGSTFPTPGADAFGKCVELPTQPGPWRPMRHSLGCWSVGRNVGTTIEYLHPNDGYMPFDGAKRMADKANAPGVETPGPRRWTERWYGSGPDRGWWVWEADRGDRIAYCGEGEFAERLCSLIVQKHNDAVGVSGSQGGHQNQAKGIEAMTTEQDRATVAGLMTLLRRLETAAGAMIVNAGGPSFYDSQDERNAAREAIRSYAERLAQVQQVPQWMPIETAPKNGAAIGVWTVHDAGTVKIVRWGHHLGIEKHPPCWVTVTRGIAISNLPTHWLPLPAAPASPGEAAQTTEDKQC
jgi:hypothetical protein